MPVSGASRPARPWIRTRQVACVLALLLAGTVHLQAALPALFAELSSDKESPFQSEAFQLILSVFVSGETLDKALSVNGLPAADRIELGAYEELAIGTEVREGRTYEVRRYRWPARARDAGPVAIRLGLGGEIIRSTQAYFFTHTERRPVRIPIADFMLTVRSLPGTGKPDAFSGAVGNFVFKATVSPLDIAPGDLVTLTYVISGDRLPEGFRPPVIRGTAAIKAYEVKPVPAESTAVNHVFRQVVVPADVSVTAIPAVAFSYFDGRQGEYRTLSAGPFPLTFHAERGPAQTIYVPTQAVGRTQALVRSPASGPSAEQASGWWRRLWLKAHARQEAHIGTDSIPVRLSPSDTASPLFTLKPGARVELDSEWRDWVRIECKEGIGWVPRSALRL